VVTGATNVGNVAAAQAHADVEAAAAEVAARTGGATLAGALAGATIKPGLHTVTGAASNTTTVTLDAEGDPRRGVRLPGRRGADDRRRSHVVLVDGARASRVFWLVDGAASIGANADFAGT
jgi:hypothetical protein